MIPQLSLIAQHESIKVELDQAITRVVESGRFILGPEVEAFEQEIAAYCGTDYAVGVASGTDALELSLRACDLGPGDEVITTPFSFIATGEAIVRAGARPVLVDIDPKTFNIDAVRIEQALSSSTKAILPVHLFGQPAAMEAIIALAETRGLKIIEDCAQAIGAGISGRRVGSFGDAGALSFFPSKNLGCLGDGGMVVTNNKEVADRVRLLRAHGQTAKYLSEEFGLNSRLDAIQAAVLSVKLTHLAKWTALRQKRAALYDNLLKDSGVQTPYVAPDTQHVFNQYTIRSSNRDELRKRLTEEGIGTAVYYPVPFHMQKAFAYLGHGSGDFPEAEKAGRDVLSLPMFPEISETDVRTVCDVIRSG